MERDKEQFHLKFQPVEYKTLEYLSDQRTVLLVFYAILNILGKLWNCLNHLPLGIGINI